MGARRLSSVLAKEKGLGDAQQLMKPRAGLRLAYEKRVNRKVSDVDDLSREDKSRMGYKAEKRGPHRGRTKKRT